MHRVQMWLYAHLPSTPISQINQKTNHRPHTSISHARANHPNHRYSHKTGHGSGKLFCQAEDGSLNFDAATVDPTTGQPVSGFYKVCCWLCLY